MKSSKGKGLFALIFGALIGAITALFLGTNEEGDIKESVKKGVKSTKKKAKDLDKKKVMDKVGKKINKSSAEFKKAKDNLTKKLNEAKKKFDTIDKTRYQKLVTEVADELKKTGKTTATQIKDIKALLVEDYKKVAPTPKKKPANKKKKVAKK